MEMNENKTEGASGIEKSNDSQGEKSIMKFLDTKLVALFILGVLIGLTVKTQASKTITMGFDDYKIKKPESQELNVSGLKKKSQEEEKIETEAEILLEEETVGSETDPENVEVLNEGAETDNQNDQDGN